MKEELDKLMMLEKENVCDLNTTKSLIRPVRGSLGKIKHLQLDFTALSDFTH